MQPAHTHQPTSLIISTTWRAACSTPSSTPGSGPRPARNRILRCRPPPPATGRVRRPGPAGRRRPARCRECCSFPTRPHAGRPRGGGIQLHHLDRPRRGARRDGIDHHGQVGAIPQAEKVERVVERPDHGHSRALLRHQGRPRPARRRRRGGTRCPCRRPPPCGHAPAMARSPRCSRCRSRPDHRDVEEVGSAGNARVVVAHRLLAAPGQIGVRKVEATLHDASRSASMLIWFCEVGGTIRAVVMSPSALSA